MDNAKSSASDGAGKQIDKFKAAARAIECNEDEAAFKRSLRAIAKAPVEKKEGRAK